MKTVISLALVAYVLAAPIQEKPNEVDKRRESTKETIELENTLKRLAGEDKKFFSNPMSRPMPQVDGLEEKGSGIVEVEATNPNPKPVPINPLEEQLNIIESTNDQPQPAQANVAEEKEEDLPQHFNEPQSEPVDEAVEDEIEAVRHPIPGPYGPGLESSQLGPSLEYEPVYTGMDEHAHNEQEKPNKEEEEEDEEEEDEDYFLERVMETLRRHPELISELIQGNQDIPEGSLHSADKRTSNIADEKDLQSVVDYEDRMNVIQAELAAIRAQNDPQFAAAYQHSLRHGENEQSYLGDEVSHVVAKKKSLPGEPMAIPKEYMEDSIESLNRYFDEYAGDEGSKRGDDMPIM